VSPPDGRQLTVRVRALGASGETAPRVVDYRIEVAGLRPGERAGLTLAFYDGADPAGEPVPGRYQVREYDLGMAHAGQGQAGPALELAVSLPTEYSGWAVREVRAGGWAWPFAVDSGEPPAPGSTPAGAPVAQGNVGKSVDTKG
jgi:hypothetical protein